MKFTPHHGGHCPCALDTPVELLYRGPENESLGIRIRVAPAGRMDWSHDGGDADIIAWREYDPS